MKIITWNVNSIRSRLSQVLEVLDVEKPDIALLQEIKCTAETFPYMEIEERGYNIALHGEKSYNGVAILSKFPLEDVVKQLPGDETDAQCRYIEAVVSVNRESRIVNGDKSRPTIHDSPFTTLRVASVYVPNGQEVGSDKFAYKLRFLARLRAHLQTLWKLEEITIIGGDYNVAPWPEDVYDPAKLDGTVCYHPAERALLRSIFNDGWVDAVRMVREVASCKLQVASESPAPLATCNLQLATPSYTWWDYRANSLAANHGYRIDHLLLSPQAADRMHSTRILTHTRAQEKASDHAPVEVGVGV